ncbi:MAG: tyrosine-type recombinase/integrase [Dehalococcoidales bacterium]|nr:tyrosine-type recombinase/integrase [Dehalococcoidales bacterium]
MKKVTLTNLIIHYAQSNKAEGKSPNTVVWYSEMLHSYTKFLESNNINTTLAEFNVVNVRQFIIYEQERQVSPFTVQCKVRSLKAFSSWLLREGYTKDNILANVKLPKTPNRIIEPLTQLEIEKLFAAQNPLTSVGSRDIAILTLLLDTGLRESELCNLKREDTHIEEGFIKVMGKGAKERIIPFGARTQKVLWRYSIHFRPDPENEYNDYFFLTLDARKLIPNAVRQIIKRWGKRVGIPRLHVHLCRHTFATNFLVYECGDVFRLQQLLGHTSLEMVRRYVHYASDQDIIKGHVVSPMDKIGIKGIRGYKIDKILRKKDSISEYQHQGMKYDEDISRSKRNIGNGRGSHKYSR